MCQICCTSSSELRDTAQTSCACVVQECETWLNIAGCEEEIGQPMETLDHSFSAALSCAERSGLNKLQVGSYNDHTLVQCAWLTFDSGTV